MSESVFKVAGVQMDVQFGEVDANLARMETHLRTAAEQGAKLVVFPECALTGYCFESLEEALPHAQAVPGPATEQFAAWCAELQVFAVFGMLEREQDHLFNCAVCVGPKGLVGAYRKVHLPGLGVDNFATPGDRPFEVLECDGLRIGINICYDGSFPEAARVLALEGADLIVLPTNWPPAAESFARCLIPARALENHIYYLAANRVGTERGFEFIGMSQLCNPHGETVGRQLDKAEETIFYGELRPHIARNKHLVRIPGKHEIHRFRDRRPDQYGLLVAPVTDDGPPETTAYLKQLWAPWRLAYITGNKQPSPVKPLPKPEDQEFPPDYDGCFLCRVLAEENDEKNLIIHRGEHTVSILNRFPYNNGHLLVAPKLHKSRLEDLTDEEQLECLQMITKLIHLAKQVMNAEGFNVGLNLGRTAGAGLPGHLHWHIVPRWSGDTNFMPVLAGVHVIPQSLEALWHLLTSALQQSEEMTAQQPSPSK